MTVKELKRKLQEYDDNLTVWFEYDNGCAYGLIEEVDTCEFIHEKIVMLAEK